MATRVAEPNIGACPHLRQIGPGVGPASLASHTTESRFVVTKLRRRSSMGVALLQVGSVGPPPKIPNPRRGTEVWHTDAAPRSAYRWSRRSLVRDQCERAAMARRRRPTSLATSSAVIPSALTIGTC